MQDPSHPRAGFVLIDGAYYRLTGYWCPWCGLPRIPHTGYILHPLCQAQKEEQEQHAHERDKKGN